MMIGFVINHMYSKNNLIFDTTTTSAVCVGVGSMRHGPGRCDVAIPKSNFIQEDRQYTTRKGTFTKYLSKTCV